MKSTKLASIIIFGWMVLLPVCARSQESRVLIVHLRGVPESKISVMPLTGPKAFKPVADASAVNSGATAFLVVPMEYLPGEFMLQFDSKNGESAKTSPSQKNIFINNQDLELWINPSYTDSTRFQEGELENNAFAQFSKQNEKKKQQLVVLNDFLMNYEAKQSGFYQQALKEYEQQRVAHNQSLRSAEKRDQKLFVSSIYQLNYIPTTPFTGSEQDKIKGVIQHYFDGMNFRDTLVIKTAQIIKWMDAYVNLHGRLSTTMALRDSLFPAAARSAIEKARTGHPLMYGWMVDYFYRGFESNNLLAGIKVLEQYTSDPNCLTAKRIQIEKRLKGMKSLTVGTIAPNIILNDPTGNRFDLSKAQMGSNLILLLFYSADCGHCTDLIKELKPWLDGLPASGRPEVVAISLDDTEIDIKRWSQLITGLPDWKHLRANGISSPVANDYFLLSTPVMILLDSKTKEILALPSSFNELKNNIK